MEKIFWQSIIDVSHDEIIITFQQMKKFWHGIICLLEHNITVKLHEKTVRDT